MNRTTPHWLALVLGLGLLGAADPADAQRLPTGPSHELGVIPGYHSADPEAPEVTRENVLELDRLWPYQVALASDWTPRGASRPVRKGTLGVLARVEPDGRARIDFGRDGQHRVPIGQTDLVERANQIRLGELQKLMPNLLHAVGPRLLDPSAEPPSKPTLASLFVHEGYLTVFADPGSPEFAAMAAELSPLEGRNGVLTLVFPQNRAGNEKTTARLRELGWEVPFVLFRFSDGYTRSQLAEETPPPAVMLQTADGRVLFESVWEPGLAGALTVAIDSSLGEATRQASSSD